MHFFPDNVSNFFFKLEKKKKKLGLRMLTVLQEEKLAGVGLFSFQHAL